jgi:DNA-binding response OmpR family regulator
MNKPTSLLIVDADLHGLETLTYGFEREGCKVTRTSDLSRAVQLSRSGSPALATVMVREPSPPALEVIGALREAHKQMPILALGDVALETSARQAGATDFLKTPTYIRDVVNAGKLNAYDEEGEGLLSEYHGLFYLLRAMAATTRSCVLRLARGSQRAEIRFKDGKVTSASVRALQNLPALHHMLLWEEARVTLASASVSKPNQFPLSAQEVLDECERFMRDFAHAARDLGPPNTIYRPVEEPRPAIAGMQPNQMVPLLRLFDGKHGLADVVEESPFRIFDTIRMIRRLVEGGVLTTRAPRRPSGPQQRVSRPAAPANGARSSTGPQSMLGQWAMVPDQRGVVGDRRSPSRPLMPFGNRMFDQPGIGGDRRKPSRPVQPVAQPAQPAARYDQVPVTPGPTPLPTPAPIPLTVKKVASGDVTAIKGEIDAAGAIPPVKHENGEIAAAASELPPPVKVEVKGELDAVAGDIPPVKVELKGGELDAAGDNPPPVKVEVKGELDAVAGDIPPVRPQSHPDGFAMALEPTVQVKVAADGTPLELPPVRPAEPPAAAEAPAPGPALAPPVRRKTPTPSPALAVRSKTPIPSRVTPAAAFDAVEADFFAREADLYKREAVDTFDDLDPMGGNDGARSKTQRRRK